MIIQLENDEHENPAQNHGGAWISYDILFADDLSPREMILWTIINDCRNENGECDASDEALADMIGSRKSRLRELLNSLVYKGLISIHWNNSWSRKIYINRGG